MPDQLQPLTQQSARAYHEPGARVKKSASGVPRSAPAMLTHAATPSASSGSRRRDSASAASAPDLLALTRITGRPSRRAARIAVAMAAALSSTDAASPAGIMRF